MSVDIGGIAVFFNRPVGKQCRRRARRFTCVPGAGADRIWNAEELNLN